MKRLAGAVGILALAATMPQGFAQNAPKPAVPAPQAQAQPFELPGELKAILEDKRPLADLSIPELQARQHMAQRFAGMDKLPDDIKGKLKAVADAAQGEIAKRQQAAQAQPKPAAPAQPAAAAEAPKPATIPAQPPKQVAQAEPPKVEPPKVEPPKVEPAKPVAPAAPVVAAPVAPVVAAPAQPAAAAPFPEEVKALLIDNRPLESMSADELKARFKVAAHFAQDPALPPDVRQKLKNIAMTSREAAMMADAKAQPVPQPNAAKPAGQAAAKIEPVPVPAPVNPATPAPPAKIADATPPAPVAKSGDAAPATAPAKTADATPPAKPAAAAPVPKAADPTPVPAPVVDAAGEQKAQNYLNDKTDLLKLSDDDLRKRLDGIRELLANNDTNVDLERAVRAKLRTESDLLRQRVAAANAAKQAEAAKQVAAQQAAQPPAQPPAAGQPAQTVRPQGGNNQGGNNHGGNNNGGGNDVGAFVAGAVAGAAVITMLTPFDQVLQDHRPDNELQDEELQRRVQAYDYAYNNPGFAQGNPDDWRAHMEADRALLRERLRAERRHRERELAMQADQGPDEIIIQDAPPPVQRQRDVFAAEVDRDQLQQVLTSRAASGYQPRYSLDQIANQPQLRDAVQRIDVDTIHFRNNEAIIREEELGNLDAIGTIIERIVKRYPNEVFLIEGHTDAPGSAAHNLVLSKKRAESVKAALTAYYVIPPQNLRTVGLGARFLKIPTPDPEPENRRVSIARITDLLGAN